LGLPADFLRSRRWSTAPTPTTSGPSMNCSLSRMAPPPRPVEGKHHVVNATKGKQQI